MTRRVTDISRFIQSFAETRTAESARCLVYGLPGLHVAINPTQMAFALGILMDIVGRHAGRVTIVVSATSATG